MEELAKRITARIKLDSVANKRRAARKAMFANGVIPIESVTKAEFEAFYE